MWPYYHRHKSTLPPSVAARLEAGDPHVHTHEYGDALLKEDFAADSRKYEIDLEKMVDITCPVRIIHGLEDTEVDPKNSLQVVILQGTANYIILLHSFAEVLHLMTWILSTGKTPSTS